MSAVFSFIRKTAIISFITTVIRIIVIVRLIMDNVPKKLSIVTPKIKIIRQELDVKKMIPHPAKKVNPIGEIYT